MADAPAESTGSGQKPTTSGTGYRNLVMLMLFIVYAFNFLDRQIISILAIPIKDELALSDSQLGLLGGIAFAALYSTLGIPIAALADKKNRTWIMTIALTVWSAFTALSGMAQNFFQLFLARMGVGVGEAGGVAPAYSLITDFFPPEERARALAIYSLGIPVGSAFGVIAGAHIAAGVFSDGLDWRSAFVIVGLAGVLIAPVFKLIVKEPARGKFDVAPANTSVADDSVKELSAKKTGYLALAGALILPLPTMLALLDSWVFGGVHPQSMTVLGLSSIVAVVAGWMAGRSWGKHYSYLPLTVITVGLFVLPALVAWAPPLLAEGGDGLLLSAVLWIGLQLVGAVLISLYFATMRDFMNVAMEKPGFWLMILGASASSMMGYGIFFWLPSFFARSFGLTLVQTGWVFGGVLFVAGALGIVLGGVAGDWLGKRKKAFYATLPAVAFLITAPFYWAAVMSPSAMLAGILLFVPVALGLSWLGPVLSAFQHLFPVHMRTRASSIFLLINNLLGIGGGVYVLGRVSTVLAPTYGDESLRYSILIGSLLYLVAACFFWLASKHLAKDWEGDDSAAADNA